MPHLFALQGPGNCGKSETIIHLYSLLHAKYHTAAIQTIHGGTQDITVIMHGVKGFAVGIESQGDPNSRLKQSLHTFDAAKCEIVFCACRTSGMTVGWVNALSPTYSIHFVAQTRVANNYGVTNGVTALALMRMAGL